MYKIAICLCIVLPVNSFAQVYKEQIVKDLKIISDMMDSVKKINYVRFNMKAMERIETGYAKANTKVKLQLHPRKAYLINTDKKLEVLYNTGELNNKCLVKPHVFPYFTIALDPLGSLMRKNQHFTVHELGFDFVVRTIAMALSKEKDQLSKHLKLLGKVERNNMTCFLMVYENTSFSYYDYTVKHKETVSEIAHKLTVNDYMIRCKNNLYDHYGYLKEGSNLKIPTFYCKKALFYVDEKTMLPVTIMVYDEVGLFECYDYYNIELNNPIPGEEFKRNYKAYRF